MAPVETEPVPVCWNEPVPDKLKLVVEGRVSNPLLLIKTEALLPVVPVLLIVKLLPVKLKLVVPVALRFRGPAKEVNPDPAV